MIPVSASMLTSPYDCIELNIADMDAPTLMACFAILSEPRFKGMPMRTSIWN
jgi:hypothetical protein